MGPAVRRTRSQSRITAAPVQDPNYSGPKVGIAGAVRSNFALKARLPGTEFLDAETGRQKSSRKTVSSLVHKIERRRTAIPCRERDKTQDILVGACVKCRLGARTSKSKAKPAFPILSILSSMSSTAINTVTSFGGRHAESALHLISCLFPYREGDCRLRY
jgi:hypothetical protein